MKSGPACPEEFMHPDLPPAAAEPTVAGESQRANERRVVTTLLLGRVVRQDGSDGLCRVRNLSTGGMMFEALKRFVTGDRVSIELRNGHTLSGAVVWAREGRNGVAFDEELSDEALLTLDKIVNAGKGRARAPRFDVGVPTRATIEGRALPVVLENISQSGGMLRTSEPLAFTTPTVVLAIPNLGSRLCDRRWVREGAVGVSFVQMLRYDELAEWLEQRPTPGTTN